MNNTISVVEVEEASPFGWFSASAVLFPNSSVITVNPVAKYLSVGFAQQNTSSNNTITIFYQEVSGYIVLYIAANIKTGLGPMLDSRLWTWGLLAYGVQLRSVHYYQIPRSSIIPTCSVTSVLSMARGTASQLFRTMIGIQMEEGP